MKTKYVIITLVVIIAIVLIVWFKNAPKAAYPTTGKIAGNVNEYGQYCRPPRFWHNGYCV